MHAIVSDIHGNLEALNVVLDALQQGALNRIICLGDLVGYGPDSLECVRKSAEWDVVIAGDWDLAVLNHDPTQWNSTLNRHIAWIRQQFEEASDAERLLEILNSYRTNIVKMGFYFCHATPLDVRDWLFPEDIYCPKKLNRIAAEFDQSCIVGHSHIQGIFRCYNGHNWVFTDPVVGQPYEVHHAHKTIITAGSVGQPRDGDPRAAYMTLDGDEITFYRIDYDVDSTI